MYYELLDYGLLSLHSTQPAILKAKHTFSILWFCGIYVFSAYRYSPLECPAACMLADSPLRSVAENWLGEVVIGGYMQQSECQIDQMPLKHSKTFVQYCLKFNLERCPLCVILIHLFAEEECIPIYHQEGGLCWFFCDLEW